MLHLIQNGAVAELVQKAARVCFGEFPMIEIFERYITMLGKDMPYESGFPRLAGPGDRDHWIAAGEVLKPGLCVSGDVGHSGYRCFTDAYITAEQ